MLHHRLIDGEGCAHVLNNGAHVAGDGRGCRHLPPDDGIHQLFLSALGIFRHERHNLYASVVGGFLCEKGDGLGLVFLDANVAALHLRCLHEQLQAHDDLVCMLQHEAIVGGDVGFAFHSIDNHALGLGRRGRTEFHMRGEASASHARDACLLHAFYDFLGCELRVCVERLQLVAAVDALFPLVAFNADHDHWLAIASGINGGIDFQDGAAHR